MPRKSKYGNMPPAPAYIAKFKGDAGSYKVWGIDWLNHRVLIDRAELAWVPIKNVALEPLLQSESDDSLEAKAAQAAKELGAVLRVGDALELDDLPIIRRRLDEVVMATNEAIRACENKHAATNRKE